MNILIMLSRAIDWLNSWIGRTVMYAILVAVFVSATNAVVRKAFDISSNSWLELQWGLYGAVFMLCAANTLLAGGHIRIDVIHGRYKRSTQLWVELLGHTFFLIPLCVLMITYGIPFAEHAFALNEQSFNTGGLPTWFAKALIPAGFILLLLQAISENIKIIAILQKILPDTTADAHEMDMLIMKEEGK